MADALLNDVLRFCAALDERHLHYKLSIARAEALMVTIVVPGERWEVEFFGDGDIDVERFTSQGVDDQVRSTEEILGLLNDYL